MRCGADAPPPPPERGAFEQLAPFWSAAAQAMIGVSVGDYEAAWRGARELTEAVERQGIGEPVPLLFLPDALEALVALGRLDRAEPLLGRFDSRARELDSAWALATGHRCRGLLLAARGDLAGAGRALEQALAEHERVDLPFDRARSLLVKGTLERRLRRRAGAARALEEARSEFDRMGARLWTARARAELERVAGRPPRSRGELTAAELRVAELGAEGLSNKEIAAALFVSAHTVEVHLSHAYAKLGVHSRAQLARRLAVSKRRSPVPGRLALRPVRASARIPSHFAPSEGSASAPKNLRAPRGLEGFRYFAPTPARVGWAVRRCSWSSSTSRGRMPGRRSAGRRRPGARPRS